MGLFDGYKVTYRGDSDEDNIPCDNCGRTAIETPIYLCAEIAPGVSGKYCAECLEQERNTQPEK